MIIVIVIWASFDFRPCKKKIEIHPCKKKNCLKKVPGTTIQLIWHVLATWQLLTVQLLPRGVPPDIKFLKIFFKF